YKSGIVINPLTVTPETTIREVYKMVEQNGFSSYPVVKNKELIGIITSRDIRFVTDLDQPVTMVMTTKPYLLTVKESECRDIVLRKLYENRIEKALVVDDNFNLFGMIIVKDFQKIENKPNACRDEQGRLRVGAAVGGGSDNESRIEALVAAGIDVLLIDSSHGHSQDILQRIRET
ncbi:MAG: IMP dehydrogenase, partial [Arsenophonus sp. ET-DL12-MAG3]